MKKVIGIDLGGTNVRAGQVAGSKLLKMSESALGQVKKREQVLKQIYNVIDELIDKDTRAIGAGVPGVVDVKRGIVYDVVNIPSWKKVPLKKLLEDKYSLPVKINNDANCFVIAEKVFGQGKNIKNLVGLIIGTGLGAGLILNDKLYEGANCGAGEFGMIPFRDDILETYCSGQFFNKFYNISGEELCKKEDKRTLKIFTEFGVNMAEAIKIILYSYDPGMIILGGSVSQSYQLFKEAMLKGVNDFAYSQAIKKLRISVSRLRYPGVLGAAGLVYLQP